MTWIQSYKSPNYGPRVSEAGNEPEINMLVLHYTGMSNNSLTLEYSHFHRKQRQVIKVSFNSI